MVRGKVPTEALPKIPELSPVIDVSGLWQFPLEDELVVVRPDLEGLFLLNATARLLWEERSRGASPEDAVRTFVDTFGVSADLARTDIEATLAQWSAGVLAQRCVTEPPARGWEAIRRFSGNAESVTIDCALNGHTFRVNLEAGDLVEEIVPRLTLLSAPLQHGQAPLTTFTLVNGPDRVFVFRDGLCVAREEKTAGARAILLQEMTRLCDPSRSVQAILHAGACGTTSACVILAGASHAGKSTLCAGLMSRGLYCYSDDSAVIDRSFRVAGMPFPLALRKSSWPILASRQGCLQRMAIHRRAGEDVGFLPSNLPRHSSPAAPIEAMVFVDFQPSASTALQPLKAFETLLSLQHSGFWVEHDRSVIAGFLRWIALLPRYKLTYSSLDDAAAIVQDLLA